MKYKEYILDSLTIITSPNYWLQNYKYSKEWDKKLNDLMETNNFVIKGLCKAKLGDLEIWIENHPYASFTNYELFHKVRVRRPSRRTILKASRKLLKDNPTFSFYFY